MDLQGIGKLVLLAGLGITLVGGLLWLGGRMGLGSLPGDIRVGGENWSCFVPIASSIIISLVLTLVLNLVWRWLR